MSDALENLEVDLEANIHVLNEMELCSNAILACSSLLNIMKPEDEFQLTEVWNQVKQQVVRDLLLFWTGKQYTNSNLNSQTSILLKSESNDYITNYNILLESAQQHFGGESAPKLFQYRELDIGAGNISEYLNYLTHHKDKLIRYDRIELHQISSVYDEILDYTPTFLTEPRKWHHRGNLPFLKKHKEDDGEPELLPGDIGLLRIHSRDNAASERDKKGAFYTPYAIAYDIVKRTLEPLTKDKTRDAILKLNICDSALGSGVFLLAASDYLAQVYLSIPLENEVEGEGYRENSRYSILDNCVYGVDIDQTALIVAEGILSCSYQDGSAPPIDFSGRLKIGNSLLGLLNQQWATIPHMAHDNPTNRKAAKKANITMEQTEELKEIRRKIKTTEANLKNTINNPTNSSELNFFPDKINVIDRYKDVLKELKNDENNFISDFFESEKGPLSDSAVELLQLLRNPNNNTLPIAKDFLDTHLSIWWWEKQLDSNIGLTSNDIELYLRYLFSTHSICEGEMYSHLQKNLHVNIPLDYYETILHQAQELSNAHSFFHWELEFSEIFLEPESNGGFDALIGNPPWGIKFDSVQQRRFDWAFPLSGDNEAAWALFELAMRLVRPDEGRVGYIIPNTFLLNKSSEKLRKEIVNSWVIEEIVDYCNVAIFEGAAVRACQIHIKKGNCENDSKFTLHRPEEAIPEGEGFTIAQSTMHHRNHWGSLELQLNIDPENFISIGECCSVRQGYKPYVSGKFTARGLEAEEVERIMEERPYHHQEDAEGRVMQIYGSDVKHFSIQLEENDERWVEHVEGAVAELMPEEFTSGRRIMIREIVNKLPRLIIASYTEMEFVHDPGVIMLRPNESYEQMYDIIELYLNSSVCENHVKYYSAKAGKGLFAKFTLGDIKQLPLPKMEDIPPQIFEEASILINECRSGSKIDDEKLMKVDDFVLRLYNKLEEE